MAKLTSISLVTLAILQTVATFVLPTGTFSLETIKLPRDDATTSASKDGTADLDGSWHVTLKVGTPPQSLNMIADTGAGNLAVSSTLIPKNETNSDGTPYDPSKSSTAKQVDGLTYKNCYASGHCGHGVVYQDKLTLGDISVNMKFEVSTGNNGVGNGGGGGDFGLAFSKNGMSSEPTAIPTWLQTVLPTLDAQVFTIDYNKNTNKGEIEFGVINKNKYSGDIGYAPLNGNYYWGVNFTGYQSGGKFIKRTWTVVVDSGTSVSGLPKDVADGYFKAVDKAVYDADRSTYKFPCSADLPNFVYGIGSFRGTIPGDAFRGQKIADGNCLARLNVKDKDSSVIFGQNFIEEQFVVFDYKTERVGFAKKAN